MIAVADAVARRTPNSFSMEMWGGATFDTAMRFLHEDPWRRCAAARTDSEHLFQMLFRGSNAVAIPIIPKRRRRFVKHSAGLAWIFSGCRLAELPAEPQGAMEAVNETHAVCEGAICYTGNILDKSRSKYR